MIGRTRKATGFWALLVFLSLIIPVSVVAWTASWASTLQEEEIPGAAAAAGVMVLVFLVFFLVIYAYFAICLQTIAKKTNTPNGWWGWIPILNIILMLNIARKPIWWIVLLLIPFVNIVIAIIVWMAIAEARGKPSWWGILMIVPFLNFIVPGYLAFSD